MLIMKRPRTIIGANLHRSSLILGAFILLSLTTLGRQKQSTVEVNGFIMVDAGYNFNTIDPDWFDVMRPTKLPASKGQFAPEGNAFFSVRQTRFGIKSSSKIPYAVLKTQLDFDLFGFGKNTGQTTLHLINAYAQVGQVLFGQTASIFMDQEAVPVTLDYWGPMARVFNFNVQLRYMPIWTEEKHLAFSAERPGATADGGDGATSIQLNEVKPAFSIPNILVQYRQGGRWGHIQIAAMVKQLKWYDASGSTTQNLSGSTIGWGWTISSMIKAIEGLTFKMQLVQGQGIESHIADAPADVVPATNDDDPARPIKGIAQPVWGYYTFAEINWSPTLATTVGYSQETVKTGNLQSPKAFRRGRYGLVNLRWLPSKEIMIGIEYQYGKRQNAGNGFSATGNKLQLSAKYSFSSRGGT